MTLEVEPTISRRRGFSAVWIIPLVAFASGVWLVGYTLLTQGPSIEITFKTAEGIEAGKTKVRVRNVVVGMVEKVHLSEDTSEVIIGAKLDPDVRPMLRADTQFWVVRARIGTGNISGIGTVLGGAYIELAPGTEQAEARQYVGLEDPPLTPADAPGLRLVLSTTTSASVSTGDPLLFNGFRVGRVESSRMNPDTRSIHYEVFIDAPYHRLVDSSVRFWDASGIAFNASADGISLNTGSLDTLLIGGVAFGRPPGVAAGTAIDSGTEFTLYESFERILESPYKYGRHFVTEFSQSLRGLQAGATVEYRGITVGHVDRILLQQVANEFGGGENQDIPVLMYLEPGRLALPDTAASLDELESSIEAAVVKGLRAELQTGNLLTGKQFINIDYYPGLAPEELGQRGEYRVIPSIPSVISRLEHQVSKLLETLNNLPLDETVDSANAALVSMDGTLVSLDEAVQSVKALLDSDGTHSLPDELTMTLAELRGTLKGLSPGSPLHQGMSSALLDLNALLSDLRSLMRTLSDQPSAVIHSPPTQTDPVPEAPSR